MHNQMKKGLAIACGILLILATVLSFFNLLFSVISYIDYRDSLSSGYYDYDYYYDDYYEDDYYDYDSYDYSYDYDYYEDDYYAAEGFTTLYPESTLSPSYVSVEYSIMPSWSVFLQPFALLLLAIAMLRQKKDIFAGVSLGLYALTVLLSLFPWYGFSMSTFFCILVFCFLGFLSVVCFTGGKFRLKGASILYLIIGLVLGLGSLFMALQFVFSDYYWFYGSSWRSIFLLFISFNEGILLAGIFSFLGGAFLESKDQPVIEAPTAPISPYMPSAPIAPNSPYMPVSPAAPAAPYRPVPPAPAAAPNYDRLRQLKSLLDDGVITEAEFEEQKKQLLQTEIPNTPQTNKLN